MMNTNAFERMAAAGMGRLLRHMMSGPFAILSADRIGMTPQEKVAARLNLKQRLRDMGFGFVDTRGAWREETGEYSHEGSFFVPGMDAERAGLLGHELGQEAIIVGDEGKYGFLGTEEAPENFDVPQQFDLSRTLDIPSLGDQPEMYTQVGKQKFVFRTDPEPDFSPEEIERRKGRYQSLANPAKVAPVRDEAFHAHIYSDKPPIMMSKFAVTRIGDHAIPATSSLIVDVPFVARIAEVLPEFEPSPHWGRPIQVRTAAVAELPSFTHADPDTYEQALAGFSRFHGEADDLFMTQSPGGRNMLGFDSLYLGPSGNFFLLQPHTHDDTSRRVLRTVHPELPLNRGKAKGGGYTHTDLTKASGIQRVQIYRDGMGVTIDMMAPPNRAQLNAIREAYKNTPMERFVAEITLGGKLVTHLQSFGQLVHFVNSWDPDDPSAAIELDPKLGELYDRNL